MLRSDAATVEGVCHEYEDDVIVVVVVVVAVVVVFVAAVVVVVVVFRIPQQVKIKSI